MSNQFFALVSASTLINMTNKELAQAAYGAANTSPYIVEAARRFCEFEEHLDWLNHAEYEGLTETPPHKLSEIVEEQLTPEQSRLLTWAQDVADEAGIDTAMDARLPDPEDMAKAFDQYEVGEK